MPYAIAAVVIVIGAAVTFFFFNSSPQETMSDEPSAINRQNESENLPTDSNMDSDTMEAEVMLESDADMSAEGSAIIELPNSDSSEPSGTYTADASYLTPRRTEHDITVELTVVNGIITDADVIYGGPDGAPENPNQTAFDEAFAAEVIGQPIDDVELSRVGGASLTSNAFNEAVAEIAVQAS